VEAAQLVAGAEIIGAAGGEPLVVIETQARGAAPAAPPEVQIGESGDLVPFPTLQSERTGGPALLVAGLAAESQFQLPFAAGALDRA
jgi:hypothetical protein